MQKKSMVEIKQILKIISFLITFGVATLTLGSCPRQGLAKGQAKYEARESHFKLPRVQKSVRE
jgi:hypothetical protein